MTYTDLTLEQEISKYDNIFYRTWMIFLMSIPVPFLDLTKPDSIFYKAFAWQYTTSFTHGAWIIERRKARNHE